MDGVTKWRKKDGEQQRTETLDRISEIDPWSCFFKFCFRFDSKREHERLLILKRHFVCRFFVVLCVDLGMVGLIDQE